jgi:hypothetical protein
MRTSVALVSVLFFATGCGIFGSEYSGEAAQADIPLPPPPAPNAAPPTAPPLDGTPVDAELTEAFGVFVATTGDDDADGSRAHPLATIRRGVAMGKALGKRVYVCEGTYREAITVEDSISIVSGLTCGEIPWRSGGGRARIEAPSSPAVSATNITRPTRLEALEIVAPDASAPSGSSIGVLAIDAGALTVSSTRVVAGVATAGADGTAGIQLVQTGTLQGGPGSQEREWCVGDRRLCPLTPSKPANTAGGTSVCAGAPGHDGQSGGHGGSGGLYTANSFISAVTGEREYLWKASPASDAANAGELRTGAAGAGGSNGASAGAIGTISEGGFTPADGSAGGDGQPGEGGRGGDGLAPMTSPNSVSGQTWYGNTAAGGGAGGCPGLAGTPGAGGGASIAALLVRSPVTFDHSELVAGDGGDGGRGTFGSDPTPGGLAGVNVSVYASTFGAPGGDGGASGISGSGAGGPSIAVAHAGGEPVLVETITTVGEPGAGVPALVANGKTIPASAPGVSEPVRAF